MARRLASLGFAAAAAIVSASALAQPAAPIFTLKPDKGFIDDPVALDGNKGRLALLRTDSASFARIEVIELETGKSVLTVPAGDPQQLFERLLFAGRGGVVLVTRHPSTGKRTAQHFGADGKPLGLAGPYTDFGLAVRGGQTFLIGWDQRAGGGDTKIVVSQHQMDGLARVGKARALTITRQGELKETGLKVLAWQDGFTQILGQKTGGYDKKRDVRVPDRAAVFDVLQSAYVFEQEIGDVIAWASANVLRRNRPNRTSFVVVADDEKGLLIVDAMGRRTPAPLPVEFHLFDPRSLVEQEDPLAGVLNFSLSIDPLNPDALGRQKADPEFLHVFAVRPQPRSASAATGIAVTKVLETALDHRPASWTASGKFVAVLRKHKSFSRGGDELQVFAAATTP